MRDELEERLKELLAQPRTISEILCELNEPGDLRTDVSNRLRKGVRTGAIEKIDPGTQYLLKARGPSKSDEVAYRRMMFMLTKKFEQRISKGTPITNAQVFEIANLALRLYNAKYPDAQGKIVPVEPEPLEEPESIFDDEDEDEEDE